MRAITMLADRMLSAIVPEVRASAAGCGSYWVSCSYCHAENWELAKLCTYSSNCRSVRCSPCVQAPCGV
jgi:hypothetical protein